MRRRVVAAPGVALTAALVVLLLAAAPGAAQTAQPGQPVFAPLGVQVILEAVKRSITNWDAFDAANDLAGWGNDSAVPPCLYTGVTCDADGLLQTLSLQCPTCQVKAEGTLAAEVAASPTLATFNMQANRLSGSLPPQYGLTGAFPSLLHMVVSQNQLSGSIPDEWSNPAAFPRLTLLAFSDNRLSGALPGDVALPSLLILRANDNNFSGPLPPTWGSNASMPRIRVASLQSNALTGALPAEWADPDVLSALEELYVQDNQLTGGVPADWGAGTVGAFPALRVLNLSNNPLGGSLPTEWNNPLALPRLSTLALSNTQLQGTLPASWSCLTATECGLPALQTLWLDGNNISGPVPTAWSTFSSLQAVYVRPGNEQLCQPEGSQFPFRFCDARGQTCAGPPDLVDCSTNADCSSPITLEPCPQGDGSAGGAAAGGDSSGSSSGSGGGGSNTGAIVGGVVGGVVAVLAAAALVWARRRKRRRRHEQGLPYYASDQGTEKGPRDDESFGFGPHYPGPPPPIYPLPGPSSGSPYPGPSGPSSAQPHSPALSNGDAAHFLPSPFAAMAAELEGEQSLSEPGAPLPAGQLEHHASTRSSGYLAMLMGAGEAGGGRGNALDSGGMDRKLEEEVSRHLKNLSGDISPLPLSPHDSSPQSPLAVSGGAGPMMASSPVGSASQGMQWERSIDLSDWQILPDELEICKRPDGSEWELGSGGFGKVYKAMRHSAQPVAIKVLAQAMNESTRYQSQEDFMREIAILRACRDPNIVSFLGACLQSSRTMLVTEYCDGGNLTRNLVAGRVTWARRGKKIALDVARGLTYLHSRRIIHFDLKSPNILLARDGTAKISDVGMAKIMAREYSGITGNVGTLAWAAPEMLLGARCTEKADVYSYGVVLWEICTASTPIRGQLRDVRVPDECPPEVRELILDCLATNPRKRPSAVEIVDRLRAMADPPQAPQQQPRPPGTSTTAGTSSSVSVQSAGGSGSGPEKQQRLRHQRPAGLPRPPSRGADVQQQQRGGAAGSAAGHSPRLPPGSQRASEDSTISVAEQEPRSGQGTHSGTPSDPYASPVPGTPAGQATLYALEAARRGSAGDLPSIRSDGVLLASIAHLRHDPHVMRSSAPEAPTALTRASSSPAPAAHRPWFGEDAAHTAAQQQRPARGAAAGRAPKEGLIGAVVPDGRVPAVGMGRQQSLDDPARQLAELRRSWNFQPQEPGSGIALGPYSRWSYGGAFGAAQRPGRQLSVLQESQRGSGSGELLSFSHVGSPRGESMEGLAFRRPSDATTDPDAGSVAEQAPTPRWSASATPASGTPTSGNTPASGGTPARTSSEHARAPAAQQLPLAQQAQQESSSEHEELSLHAGHAWPAAGEDGRTGPQPTIRQPQAAAKPGPDGRISVDLTPGGGEAAASVSPFAHMGAYVQPEPQAEPAFVSPFALAASTPEPDSSHEEGPPTHAPVQQANSLRSPFDNI